MMRIEAKNLIKIYGDRSVVNDISFYIEKGGPPRFYPLKYLLLIII